MSKKQGFSSNDIKDLNMTERPCRAPDGHGNLNANLTYLFLVIAWELSFCDKMPSAGG
jgi:hypothetical protein